jgi:Tfp pilus assembly protein PilN
MPNRNDTLILITRLSAYRLRLTGTRSAEIVSRYDRVGDEPIAGCVAAVLRGATAKRVWVASTELWVGEVAVDRETLAVLGNDGIAQTLAIEAEGYSGISAFMSRIAHHRIAGGSGNRYAVLQLSEVDFGDIDAVVKANGGKLMGVGSAGITVPPQLNNRPTGGAADGMIVCELDSTTTLLSSRGELTFRDSGIDTSNLADATDHLTFAAWSDADSVVRWAGLWLSQPIDADQDCLIVKQEKKPIASSTWTAIALGVAGLLLVATSLYQWTMTQRIDQLNEEIAMMRDGKAQLDNLKKSLQADESLLVEEREKLTSERQRVVDASHEVRLISEQLDSRRMRWQGLMNAIASSLDAGCFLQSMKPMSDRLQLIGYCVDAQEANRSAESLSRAIEQAGWAIGPAEIEFTDKQLYQFKITASPAPIRSIPSQPDKSFVHATRVHALKEAINESR